MSDQIENNQENQENQEEPDDNQMPSSAPDQDAYPIQGDLHSQLLENLSDENLPNSLSMSIVYKYFNQKFSRLLLNVMDISFDNIMNYLDLEDLCNIRLLNTKFKQKMNVYYLLRLKTEIEVITNYQEQNQKLIQKFMQNVDTQIPLSHKNWLDFNLSSVIEKLKLLDKETIMNIKSIKSIGKFTDKIYAPFCILMDKDKEKDLNIKNKTWKYVASKILSQPNIKQILDDLDKDNLNEALILEAFIYLNAPELEILKIQRFNKSLTRLILWCQGLVSYHILIHPYVIRNDNGTIPKGGEVETMINTLNNLINRFYKFKRFLWKIKVAKIPLADYIFNLQHSRTETIKKVKYELMNKLPINIIAKILTYIPYSESYHLKKLNKKFRNGFIGSVYQNILSTMIDLYTVKLQIYSKINSKLPEILTYNLFSKFFLMLDDILNNINDNNTSYFVPFLSMEHINNLKNLKLTNQKVNQHINSISYLFCLITNIKPKRIYDGKGILQDDYLKSIKSLIYKNEFNKTIRKFDKLFISKENLNIFKQEIFKFLNPSTLTEIKKINLGLYQLLIWEICVFYFILTFNPFEILESNFIIENNNNYDKEDIEVINIHSQLLSYLKFNLSIRFHCSDPNCPSYNLLEFYSQLKQFLVNKELFNEIIFKSINDNFEKIGNLYFECRDHLDNRAKPNFYQRIIEEIVLESDKINSDYFSLNN